MPSETGISRFLVLSGLAFVLVFAGLATLNGAPLALAIPLVIYLGIGLFNRPPSIQLEAQRSLSADTLKQGQPVKVTLRITNTGPNLDEAEVDDRLPAGLELVEGKNNVITSLPAGATVELQYTVRGPRGRYFFQDVLVSASDHLSVMRERVAVPARMRLLYLPEVSRLKRVAIRPLRTHGHFGPIPSRQPGSGVDFYGMRDYQVGDPRRWINWRASARYQEQHLFVNQFEQERIADVGVILDARQQSNIILENGDSLFEYSVYAAGSLSEALLNDGNRVGLLIYGYGVERTFPGYGKVQQERILRALGSARTGQNFALESLGYLPTRFFPAGSQVVMVSPLLASDFHAFMQLRATGYEVLVVTPDPVSFEARGMGVEKDLAWRIARAERALMLRKLQRMGVRILDWQVQRPFEPLVRASLSRVTPGRRMGLGGVQ